MSESNPTEKSANEPPPQEPANSEAPSGEEQVDSPSIEDTLLEEEELLSLEEDDIQQPPQPLVAGEGTILVPRISPRGVTVERLKGNRKKAGNVELIEVKDDRVGEMKKLGRNHYLQLIMPLHVELLKLQNYVREKRLRVVVLFEGRDAAGKGGTIKRFIEHMNPRGCRVVALDKPTDEERGQWYFQRYVKHLPTAGEIVLFDRSWYNRAMVERVMGFCKDDEVREFLRSVPEFERMLIRSGITLMKYYFSVSKKEQMRRFQKRLDDPLKQWKLSPVDLESQDKWDGYKKSKEDMFFYTSTADCPWNIIKSDEKKRARINAIRHFLGKINYPKDYPDMLGVDGRIVKAVHEELGSEI
jgi:polyphosphate kinase 2